MEKVVLAYSGGLDTSCCIRWIKEKYGLEVVCFSAFIGEVPDAEKLKAKALKSGAKKCYVYDLKKEFAYKYILPSFWAHARYEGKYLLATSIGRPLIAKKLVEVAHKEGAGYVAHGCTGKGNDQVRIEVGVRTLDPKLKIIAPLKEWEFTSREEEIDYATQHKIPIDATKKSPYSIDKNIWGIAIEAGMLEDPWVEPPEGAYVLTASVAATPDKPKYVEIEFVAGVPVKVDGVRFGLVELIERLNIIVGRYGIGRVDMIEDRLVGIKSREIYEAPAATVLMAAHEEIESLVFDRDFLQYKRLLSEKYAELVYTGLWFSPLKDALDAFFAQHQNRINGKVRVRLEKGSMAIVGRTAKKALYKKELATYSADDVFDRTAANGFIKLWGLPYEGTR
jgi:argininosuccinate synthase